VISTTRPDPKKKAKTPKRPTERNKEEGRVPGKKRGDKFVFTPMGNGSTFKNSHNRHQKGGNDGGDKVKMQKITSTLFRERGTPWVSTQFNIQ